MNSSISIADKSLYIADKTFEELLAQFLCPISNDIVYYETLAGQLYARYPHQLQLILPLLSEERLLGAIRGITHVGASNTQAWLYQYTTHRNPQIAAAALEALGAAQPLNLHLLMPFLQHEAAAMRCAALRLLRNDNARSIPVQNALLDALADPAPSVKYTALEVLDGRLQIEDLELIAPLLKDSDTKIREMAKRLMSTSNTPRKTLALMRQPGFRTTVNNHPHIQTIKLVPSVQAEKQTPDTLDLENKSFEELMSLFFIDIRSDENYYDMIGWHMAANYLPQLAAMLPVLQGSRLRSAIFGISAEANNNYDEILYLYLNHDDERTVTRALEALQSTQKMPWERVAHLFNHPSPMVRSAALCFAKDRLGEAIKPLLIAALNDTHAVVRLNALQETQNLLRPSELSMITPLLHDEDRHVRQTARQALKNCKDRWYQAEQAMSGVA